MNHAMIYIRYAHANQNGFLAYCLLVVQLTAFLLGNGTSPVYNKIHEYNLFFIAPDTH